MVEAIVIGVLTQLAWLGVQELLRLLRGDAVPTVA